MEETGCVAVVIPCFNEAASVERAVQRVLANPLTAEVVLVDDGSDDGTTAIVRSIDDPRLRVFEHQLNLGKGAALRRGFAEVTAPYVVVQDADLEYDPADHEALVAPLRDGRADVVYGSRFTPNAHRVLYYWHAIANRVLTLGSNMTTNLNLTDVTTGAKAFRREVVQSLELQEDRFGIECEITAKVAAAGWRVFEVGVSYNGRTYAEGKKVGWADGVRSLYAIARYTRAGERVAHPRLVRHRDAEVTFEDADSELSETLDTLDDAGNYADWIVSMVAPHVGGEIIEIGAGHGTMAQRLADLGQVTANEPSARAAAVLRDLFADDPRVSVAEGYADEVLKPETFDSAVMINVLEHIPDDLGVLRSIHRGLRPGGTIAVFVPAHEALYSAFDNAIGHQRRYRRSTLNQVVAQAGFELVDLRYVNLPGVPAWFLFARVLGRRPTAGAPARTFDRVAVPVLRVLERGRAMPSGLSLLAIARKPHAPHRG